MFTIVCKGLSVWKCQRSRSKRSYYIYLQTVISWKPPDRLGWNLTVTHLENNGWHNNTRYNKWWRHWGPVTSEMSNKNAAVAYLCIWSSYTKANPTILTCTVWTSIWPWPLRDLEGQGQTNEHVNGHHLYNKTCFVYTFNLPYFMWPWLEVKVTKVTQYKQH
jgi:hypothetical protein